MAVYVSRINDLLDTKSKRERRKYSIEDVAKFVGVSRQTVYVWAGYAGVDRKPAATHMSKLCQFFGVTEAELWLLVEDDTDEQPLPGMDAMTAIPG